GDQRLREVVVLEELDFRVLGLVCPPVIVHVRTVYSRVYRRQQAPPASSSLVSNARSRSSAAPPRRSPRRASTARRWKTSPTPPASPGCSSNATSPRRKTCTGRCSSEARPVWARSSTAPPPPCARC